MKMNNIIVSLVFIIILHSMESVPLLQSAGLDSSHPAVERFREYLRIDTSKQENLYSAVEFLRRQANELGLPFAVYEPGGLPVCVATWEGTDPSLPSIILNSHMDVVGVEKNKWNHHPFDAFMDDKGDIYARGVQDDKDITMQYLEAIRILKESNITLQRTFHLTFMPDEETGGFNGIKPFIETKEFASLNVGFVLDEGIASSDEVLLVTYQDRRPWQMKFKVFGNGGHGSRLEQSNAIEKIQKLINIIMNYREELSKLAKGRSFVDLGHFNSININIINGGDQTNVIPTEMSLVADLRLGVDANVTAVQSLVDTWLEETGNGTQLEFIRKDLVSMATAVNYTNPYWMAMKTAISNMGYEVRPIISPATSDLLVIRNKGIPAVGFSPKFKTESRIHGANEYLNSKTFLKGINIFVEIIKNLGVLP